MVRFRVIVAVNVMGSVMIRSRVGVGLRLGISQGHIRVRVSLWLDLGSG